MVWKKRLQLNGAWHVSPILLVWPQRKGLSEASPPSLSVPWSYSKDVFVGKDKLPSEQMRTLNRSSSLFGKVIYQPKMCRLTDKPIKGREILEFMRVEESHTKSVLLTTFIYSDFWFLFQLYNPHALQSKWNPPYSHSFTFKIVYFILTST